MSQAQAIATGNEQSGTVYLVHCAANISRQQFKPCLVMVLQVYRVCEQVLELICPKPHLRIKCAISATNT